MLSSSKNQELGQTLKWSKGCSTHGLDLQGVRPALTANSRLTRRNVGNRSVHADFDHRETVEIPLYALCAASQRGAGR